MKNWLLEGFARAAALVLFVFASGAALAYEPGQTYFATNNYSEYIAGNLPIIISAPHGGYLKPDEIPNRTWGVRGIDTRTQELIRAIHAELVRRTGRHPHIIINHLYRSKLDANRDIEEAAQGSPIAEQAWHEYHNFIEAAKSTVTTQYERGLYIDLHGHGHKIRQMELGYLLSTNQLELSDEELNKPEYAERSSLRTLAREVKIPFSELLRGPLSMGGLMEARGIPAIPSPSRPHNEGAPYYSGGYNTARHTSFKGGPISGLQIECHYVGVRDTPESRAAFSALFAECLEIFLQAHYGIDIRPAPVHSIHFDKAGVVMTWKALNARSFLVQQLSDGIWIDVEARPVAGDLISVTNSFHNTATFRAVPLPEAAQD